MNRFANIWLADAEFRDSGDPNYSIHCFVFKNFRTKEVVRCWQPQSCLIDFGPDSLLVSYYAIAEIRGFLSLGWTVPANVLDLFAEFRVATNGIRVPNGNGLLGALSYYGLPGGDAAEKEGMREIAMRGGPFTVQEREHLLNYCQSDVEALGVLLGAMAPHIDWNRALIRGQYMAALSQVERSGVPVDTDSLTLFQNRWPDIKLDYIKLVDARYGVYDGEHFVLERFESYLASEGIPWPRTECGRLDMQDDTFRELSKAYPQLDELRELRYMLGQMRLVDLRIGSDNRNRAMLSPFRSITGRNQPSNTEFIFGPGVWIRNFIRPSSGQAIAYVDYSQQEFGLAAALSGDENMWEAYDSGDPYLAFAKQAGSAPANATKKTHAEVRELFKACALAVQYGMGPASLGRKLGKSEAHGRELIQYHKLTYPKFWQYIECVRNKILFSYSHQLTMGWQIQHLPGQEAARTLNTLSNFAIQGNGAEMLRLAVILAVKRGVKVCATVHDALLIEAGDADIDEAVKECQLAMEQASVIVLNESVGTNHKLRSDAKIVKYPDHYSDPRGDSTWGKLRAFIPELPE